MQVKITRSICYDTNIKNKTVVFTFFKYKNESEQQGRKKAKHQDWLNTFIQNLFRIITGLSFFSWPITQYYDMKGRWSALNCCARKCFEAQNMIPFLGLEVQRKHCNERHALFFHELWKFLVLNLRRGGPGHQPLPPPPLNRASNDWVMFTYVFWSTCFVEDSEFF